MIFSFVIVIVISGFRRRCLISFFYLCGILLFIIFLYLLLVISGYLMSEQNRIIGADYCPYCVKVKNYFQNNKIPFTWVDTETPEGAKVRA